MTIGFMLAALALAWVATRTSGAEAARARVSIPHSASTDTVARSRGCKSARKAAKFYAVRVMHWRHQMGARGSQPSRVVQAACPRYLAHVLQHKAYAMRHAYSRWIAARHRYFRRLYEKWRCIHEHEGAWNADTGNGYYGGLQMTTWFQKTYGPEFWSRWGKANNWPVWAQLTAAERAYQRDGDYGQWGTAPMCGLPT